MCFSSKDNLAPLVTKSSHTRWNNQQGQITIFFAVAVVVIVTMMSFVVNVGLFVKAKINLQNATDAAAWSGAATQARQLTDIAYMNWEMRNIYKQWMFKYYVLGNLSAKGVRNPGEAGNNNDVTGDRKIMDFTIGPSGSKDRFNIPSVCIHPRSQLAGGNFQGDICSVYSIPGLPRLTFGFTSIDQTTSALTDALAREKASDCAARSKANFNIALAWIYGTGSNEHDQKILATAPHVATNYPGAWVKAMEIVHRIRNMEYIVNTPANSNVDLSVVESLSDQNFAGHERTIKAFSSAYRNLGNDSPFGSELKNSFRLTELSPQNNSVSADGTNLSNLFIPERGRNFEKPYLDLKIMPLNFVNFFTSLIPTATNQTGTDTAREAGCEVSKIAIPVPGYPMGFTKNPKVVTYYAVKGEAEFRGLFNPIGRSITLTAYAAAKPFGGRIGPTLFNNYNISDPGSVFARSESRMKSLPYALGLKLDGTIIPSQQNPTRPAIVPADNSLWVNTPNDVIGGSTNNTEKLKYVVPNLVYEKKIPSRAYHNSPFFIYEMPAFKEKRVPFELGLYDVEEFNAFSKHLGGLSGVIEAERVENALKNVKRPTDFENLNYLIPSTDNMNVDLKIDTLGLGRGGNNDERRPIYAPLYGDNLLYQTSIEVLSSIKLFLNTQRPTIDAFIANLWDVSDRIRKIQPTTQNTTVDLYKNAANFFHNEGNLDCSSMAGQFLYYFFDSESQISDPSCTQLVSLPRALEEIYSNVAAGANLDRQLYFLELFYEGGNYRRHFTAFAPGKHSGADDSGSPDGLGTFTNPFLGESYQSLRNFYSTKLVSMQSLLPNTEQSYGQNIPLMSEGSLQDITGQTSFENPLVLQESTSDIFQ
jgi:hypothetical protein